MATLLAAALSSAASGDKPCPPLTWWRFPLRQTGSHRVWPSNHSFLTAASGLPELICSACAPAGVILMNRRIYNLLNSTCFDPQFKTGMGKKQSYYPTTSKEGQIFDSSWNTLLSPAAIADFRSQPLVSFSLGCQLNRQLWLRDVEIVDVINALVALNFKQSSLYQWGIIRTLVHWPVIACLLRMFNLESISPS